ncbi:splicing factor, arginine/serine-rich 15-like [Sinocyclocheilus anshuiensis]|uniref:splicing factor, arginine/serine-rich 15-like n=1 Tax=Sinocyclocheilus anshuiensis TaxID=1608454 RepID=UPI0007BA5C4C|nr:PREDICTED: splicing factor, arginine/serine-rich 15-like [Sinocyclocheilus anshuiensis]XP_016318104.1 PREDICTED: splicing factor, arginine/serine-rich 15-like [Sinocyclocheilus anshuiensis]XP_016318105.1 PREDICTED: splicing factor, arginine/serine-rich 15-like [Sinocyclocheilus anshuiensis]
MDMEAVNTFNGEMLSMLDMTPPISRAKMMSVTKAGIKAIKLYKHVVQIVEKFIKRCKPDLKVAGLYVVDSIIRQSRHQFGKDKDVFGPRFLKNFTVTFQNLFQCPADDKGKILRVLNLWEKNDVFSMDIIQPLLVMATAPVLPVVENGITDAAPPAVPMPVEMAVPEPAPAPAVETAAAPPSLQNPVALAAVTQLLQGTGGVELQQLIQTLQQAGGAGLPQSTAPPPEQKPSLAKSLLDRFDYDDDPEPVEEKTEPAPAAPITINLPPELQQALQAHLLSQIVNQTQMQGQMVSQGQVASQDQMAPHEFPAMVQTQMPDNTPQVFDESVIQPSTTQQASAESERSVHDGRDRRHSRRTRSRSPRSRRSRSGSRSRREQSRYHRTRSRSRERRGRSPQVRSEERRDREKERERRQKGLPPIKKETLSVCSTTLWIGQLDKKTQQQDIVSLMEEFGQIESINMIPPRGCAYIVMVHRQDAYTALNKLSRGVVKVNQKTIKIAWALNKGIKTDLKKFWDVERGVTYIPWDKVKADDIRSLQEGGLLDAETLKPEWKSVVANPAVPVTEGPEGKQEEGAALPAVSQSPSVQPVATMNPVVPGPSPNMSLPPPAMITGASPPSFPPPGFNPPQMPAGFAPAIPLASLNPAGPPPSITETPIEEPSDESHEAPKRHMDLTGAQALSPPPLGGILGPRPGPLPPHAPVGLRPPFMPPFANNGPRPIMPPPNMPPQMMPPRGPNPMFGEPPVGRFRMRMMGPPRHNFPPHRLPMRPRGEEPHWRDQGPERGPDRFGNEPPFHRGGWGRAGPRVRSRFGN